MVYLAQRAAQLAAYSSTYQPGSSFISSSQANIIIETMKTAEDGEGIIIRLYESMRKRSSVDITCAFELKSVWKTDLLDSDKAQDINT